jgi:hypothetical protein
VWRAGGKLAVISILYEYGKAIDGAGHKEILNSP